MQSNRPNTKKVNPNSIIETLKQIIQRDFDSILHAVTFLNDKGYGKFPWKDGGEKHLSRNTLRRLLLTDTTEPAELRYWHLETFASYLGLPTGIFLIFTRLRSNSQKHQMAENDRVIALMKHIIERHHSGKEYDFSELENWEKHMARKS